MSQPNPPVEGPEASPPRGWSRKTKVVLAAVVLSPLVIFGLYTLLVLTWSYSDGWRAGVLQKFSHKGYVCKTWEGELAMTPVPGAAPQIWLFSVRDEAVSRAMSEAVGQRVRIHYREHRGVPSECFATTDYFADSLVVESAGP